MSRLTYRQDEGLGTHGEGAVRVGGGPWSTVGVGGHTAAATNNWLDLGHHEETAGAHPKYLEASQGQEGHRRGGQQGRKLLSDVGKLPHPKTQGMLHPRQPPGSGHRPQAPHWLPCQGHLPEECCVPFQASQGCWVDEPQTHTPARRLTPQA